MSRYPIDNGGPVDRAFEPFPYSALDESIIDRFDTVARHFSARVAVSDCARDLTYEDLAALVDRIAATTALAVADRPGPVAILLPRDALFPAAMLGVLAAGRGYVPLDATNPTERNRLIAVQSGAAALVSAGDLARRARSLFPEDLPVVDIEMLGDAICQHPIPRSAPDDLAVIVYTSGSTGTPKGVFHNHRNLLHDVMQQTNTLHLNEEDRVALLYSPAVIAAIREIFITLLNGASLHILPPQELQSAGLVREIKVRGITVCRTVPFLLRRLVEALGPNERLDSVRVVGLGSQRVDWSDYDVFRRHFSPEAFLIVGIGSTECGGNFCHWFVDDQLRVTGSRLPIGRVLPDARIVIADNDGRPVADGEIGEFLVASCYLALGYWRDPDLTARAFAIDPADPKTRIFKTGDMGRMRPDGLLEYAGRNDQQIKLRGHRIEVGEIEFALGGCAGVKDAAIVVRKDEAGLPQSLTAYVELSPGTEGILPRDLLSVLMKRLPSHMIPTTLHVVEELPRLPNFKIDREELRRRDRAEREHAIATPANPRVEPRNKIQETLLKLWRDVLDRQDIGCNDDFFLVGGDSLSAVDLLHRIEEELQYQLPLAILAQAPTVSQLESLLETRTLGCIDNVIHVHTAGSRRPLFAVYGAGGHALGLLPVLRSLGPEQPCYALQPPGMDWTTAGCTTLPQIAAHYLGEIKAKQPQGPYRLLGISFGGLVVFEVALQLQRNGESIDHLLLVDTYPPTCLIEGLADVRPADVMADTRPPPPDSIEAQNLRIIETHMRMRRNYVLDDRLEQNIFRGKLTYLYSTANPIVAGNDRRRLWQRFAKQFWLLPLPGPHVHSDQEPQCTALQDILRTFFNGEPLTASDPAIVYDRVYRLDNQDQGENILSSTGDVYRVEQDRIQGCLDEVRVDAETVQFVGWAVEPCRQQPAQIIAVFLDGQFLGHGASGESRPDVAQRLGTPFAQYAGFNFRFRRSATAGAVGRPRLFVLSNNHRAAELRLSVEPVIIGSVVKLANVEPLRVILSGNWSTREPWGVWSDGHRAAVLFDASSLPERFAVVIVACFCPPGPSPRQNVRISDDSGYLLATISNEQPTGNFTVMIDRSRSQARSWISLIFDIDTPISPKELGINGDIRNLGIGLASLTFEECTSLPSIDS